jgi:hypothetical protein
VFVINKFLSLSLALLACLLVSCAAPIPTPEPAPDKVASADIPDPFWDFNPESNFTINYADVDAILGAMVVDTGRSTREKLPPTSASTGTRLQTKVKRTTANEGNRFYFEEFVDDDDYKEMLKELRLTLEQIPEQLPLEHFHREEQLAYWLNLYNIALLDKLVEIYPERNLKQELIGRNSILDEKFLNVAGIPLSLNDIQHTILRWNYDDNPMVIYGLYQGIIGGPNIRRWAYTGETVQSDLIDNAREFINSNRGTYSEGYGGEFHVSSFYARNLGYFNNQASALRAHILQYLEGALAQQLEGAERIVADIDDWTITDVYGGAQRTGGSLTHNPAAMQGAVKSEQAGVDAAGGGTVTTSYTADKYSAIVKDPGFSRFKRDDGVALPKVAVTERTRNNAPENPATQDDSTGSANGDSGAGESPNDAPSSPDSADGANNPDQSGGQSSRG